MKLIRTQDQINLTAEEVDAIVRDYVERTTGRQIDQSCYLWTTDATKGEINISGAVMVLKHADEETKPVNLG